MTLPTWLVFVTACLTIAALLYRLRVQWYPLLLVRLPALVWLAIVYGVETFREVPTALGGGSLARPSIILLLLSLTYIDLTTAYLTRKLWGDGHGR